MLLMCVLEARAESVVAAESLIHMIIVMKKRYFYLRKSHDCIYREDCFIVKYNSGILV